MGRRLGGRGSRIVHRVAVATLGLGLPAAALHGPVGADEAFYRNRTVRIVVGYSAGGGFDFYSRALARHLGRHLPGAPAVVVENMPGAGGLIAANHLYRVARPDGLTIGHFTGGLLLGQVLGQKGAEFEARRFEYVGAPAKEHIACALTSASGVTSVAEWRQARPPVKLGGSVPGAAQDTATRIVKAALGLPVQLVTGYRGTAEIRLAADSGELGGACFNWTSMRTAWSEALRAREVRVVLLATPAPLAELPGVPLAIDLAATPEARRLIQVGIHDQGALARPYVLPPETPAERVRAVREAFEATLRDPVFVAEAERARLDIDPVSGDELARAVQRLAELEPPVRATLRTLLFD
jgi:tripartite-type tricarboxylate transporter receptor subunit TctC